MKKVITLCLVLSVLLSLAACSAPGMAQETIEIGAGKQMQADTAPVNLLDTAAECYLPYVSLCEESAANCLTGESLTVESKSYAVLSKPVSIDVGKTYKFARGPIFYDEAVPESDRKDPAWSTSMNTVCFYGKDGSFLGRESNVFGFSVMDGKTIRKYTNTFFNAYLDLKLDDKVSYVMLSAPMDEIYYVRQLRAVENENVAINEYVPYAEHTATISGAALTEREDSDFRVLIASDLHFDVDMLDEEVFGVTNAERMQLFIDSVNAENAKEKVDALILLGDFEDGYGNNTARYFANAYASQLDMPVFAIAGEHDCYSNEEWNDVWGNERQIYFDIGDICFVFADVYRDTMLTFEEDNTVEEDEKAAEKDSKPKGKLSLLNEVELEDIIDMAIARGKIPVLLCHDAEGVIGSDCASVQWLEYLRKNVPIVFEGHTHIPDSSGRGVGNVLFINVGNFSYSSDKEPGSLLDYDNEPTRRWGFRCFEKNGDSAKIYEIYPQQTLTVEREEYALEYETADTTLFRMEREQ